MSYPLVSGFCVGVFLPFVYLRSFGFLHAFAIREKSRGCVHWRECERWLAINRPGSSCPSWLGDDVARELEQLRDRYRKTTNALASAAHDLKTPLAILNGYIDLLRSQKLGPLNDRQREVMADMFRADNAYSSSFKIS